MQRVLFVAEKVTLAQCVRLVTLARALDPERYEVHFACADFPDLVFAGTRFVRHPLASLAPELAARALAAGRRLYEAPQLLAYIDAERRLIDVVRPALVVGDFRLSLSTSAELAGVPSAVLINAYFSPFARRDGFPLPDHPIIGYIGEELAARHFPRAVPYVFRHFAAPVNAARARHRLPPIGSLLEVLAHGTFTLYPDDPDLTPVAGAPRSHRFLGPVCWQPEVAPADALEPELSRLLERGLPLIYVTLGSSGALGPLPLVLEVLARLPVVAVLATADRVSPASVPGNVLSRPFVRGTDLARRAALVISNGGSTTGYQALAQGTPVLGLPSNLDQFLATRAIDDAGAGLSVPARRVTRASLVAALERVLGEPDFRDKAREVGQRFARHDAAEQFRRLVSEATLPGIRENIASAP
jgi:UDP:flavonoid glycosyltransferase YjiC (YdhE family)